MPRGFATLNMTDFGIGVTICEGVSSSPERGFRTDLIGASGWHGAPLISVWFIMRRLFFTFARGMPGVGLLILRVVIGIRLALDGVTTLQGGPSTETAAVHVLAAGAGILLLAGLWTPIAGALVTVVELWLAFSQPGDMWLHIRLAAYGAALVLTGPGGWSVDARLFGWKRIDIPDRKS